MKGVMKNQTIKRWYTIIIEDESGIEIDRRRVVAESAREAVARAYPNITSPQKD